uniref:Shootin-1 n=1 Tax=Canis lupus dingo TaxID=286419 RepID=A0A8C0KLH7_CANLU
MNSSDEEKQLQLITSLKEQAIGEYEDLRAENQKTKEKCDKIRQERDEAVKKLEEFQKISHMVIEEVNFMQNHLEIEKTCRESAEALATKLNKENKTLKRISMLYMAKLGPDVITEEINIDDEDASTDPEGTAETCVSVQCQKQIKELRDQIVSVQEEKKILAIELENLKSKLVEVMEEVNKVKQEKDVLNSEVLEQRRVLEKCNRVEEIREIDWHNKLKRQSHLLLQSSAPDQQLLKALEENAKLIQQLEEERIQHQKKVKDLEEQLENAALHREIRSLKQQLGLLEEDKRELELKYQNSEERARDLKHSGKTQNPRSHPSGSGAKKEKAAQPETTEEVTDLKRQAVEEMMDRIKKGVHLRPVNQTARPKAKPESSKSSESAVDELKGILGTLNKSTSSRSLKSLDTENSETELERILRRRKVTAEADSSSPTGILATSESKSMPVLGSVSSVTKTALNKKTLEAEFNSPSPPTPEPGEGSCKLEGCTSSKVTFQPLSNAGCESQYCGSEQQAGPVIVLDPVSTHEPQTKDQVTEKDSTQRKDDGGETKPEDKEDSTDKMKDTDSSHC